MKKIVKITFLLFCCIFWSAIADASSVPLNMEESMWTIRYTADPEDSQSYAVADMLSIIGDGTYGKALSIGPFLSGLWNIRYDYNDYLPTELVIHGMYRTENLPASVAEISISYYKGGSRVDKIAFSLGQSSSWKEFELPVRNNIFAADNIRIGFGIGSKHPQGKAYFANLSYESSIQPLPATVDINLSRPKRSNFEPAEYVRVEKTEGVWNFVEPNGKPFFALGAVLPTWNKGDSIAAQNNADLVKAGYFNAGGGWSNYWRWAEANEEILIPGGYSPIYLINTLESSEDLAYTFLKNALGNKTGSTSGHAFPDPFDPAFAADIYDDVANSLFALDKKSWFIGRSPDNERSHQDLCRYVYSTYTAPQFKAFLIAKYSTISALNADWGTSFSSFDALMQEKPDPVGKSGPMYLAFQEFSRMIVQKYCDVLYSTIQTLDPDHLLLSPQLMLGDYGDWIEYIDIYANYADVIAINAYPDNYHYGLSENIDSVLAEVYEKTGKPIIIGEWSVPAQDSGLYDNLAALNNSYTQMVKTQQERANQTIKYVEALFNKPYVIGCYWFMWVDFEDSNRGITRTNGEIYEKLWDGFTFINSAITDYMANNATASTTKGDVLDAPHNSTYGISCGDCHSYSLWFNASPLNKSAPDYIAQVNLICSQCHNNPQPYRQMKGHNKINMGSTGNPAISAWEQSCVDCHDPHLQPQLVEHYSTDQNELYLVTAEIGGTETFIRDAANNTTTFGYVNPIVNNANFDQATKWQQKNETGPNNGLIAVINCDNRNNTYKVISADDSSIKVKGLVDQNMAGTQFALIYGQLIKAKIGGQVIKFFDPNSDYDRMPGLCNTCHTDPNILYHDRDGSKPAHYPGTNCTTSTCHMITEGLKPSAP